MQESTYSPTAAPARAASPEEALAVARARVCAQIRAALAEVEGGDFGPECLRRASTQLQAAQREMFKARVPQAFPGLPAHVQVGLGRAARTPSKKFCGCGTYLALEMERVEQACVDCQALAAREKGGEG